MKHTHLLLVTPFIFLPYVALAAPSYSVTPLVIDEEVEARDIIKRDITITNTSDQLATIFPTVNNISLTEGGTIQAFEQRVASDAQASLAAWLEISRGLLKVPAHESVTIPLTIRMHPNATPGEYHAFVGFGWGTIQHDAEKQVESGRAPGVMVTVNVVDKKVESLKLSRFIIDKFVVSANNKSVSYSVDNPGDTSLIPGGEIIFYNGKGKEVASTPVNPDKQTLEPSETIQFETTAPTKGLFGKYKGYLSIDYGNAQLASVQDTTFFYVLPLNVILIVVGVILILTILFALYIHKKYLDVDTIEDADEIPLQVREKVSEKKDHDIDLKKRS